jgi:hypothetical protein
VFGSREPDQSRFDRSVTPTGLCGPVGDDADRRSDFMMQATLHAFGWGLQRLGIVVAVTFFAALLAITIFVTVFVAIQAIAAFGQ